jgi:hypothetical protein
LPADARFPGSADLSVKKSAMKKLLLLFATCTLAFLTSCEKERTSLAGSHWASEDSRVEVIFTDTHATITQNKNGGETIETFTGVYTYDSPDFKIVGDVRIVNGVPFPMYQMEHKGTITGRTMEIGIQQTLDQVMHATLTKQ